MLDLNNLEPGQSAVYYTGRSLAMVNPELKYTAWEMYMRDEAELTQRRIPDGLFEYIVTRRREPPRHEVVLHRNAYYSNLANKAIKMLAVKS